MKSTTKLILATAVVFSLQACTTTNSPFGSIGSSSIIKSTDGSTPSNSKDRLANSAVPMPQAVVSHVSYIKTVSIPAKRYGGDQLDVSTLDDFLADVTPNARHYPPNFPSKQQRHNSREQLKHLTKWIKPYAEATDASYEVLIRAAQLNGMARNLDMGSEYTVSGSNYVAKALKLKPSDIEANLLYGIMLSEGGAFKTGRKYLNKAAKLGSVEAEQSIAQADLLSDKRSKALRRLKKLKSKNPSNPLLPTQISTIESGKYYIWDIPAPNVNVQPLS